MRIFKKLAPFLVVFVLCGLLARFFVANTVSKEMVGVLLMSLGVFSTLGSGMLAATLGKLDQQLPKGLGSHYEQKAKRKISSRRSVFWFRFWLMFFANLISATAGGVLKFAGKVQSDEWVVGVGMGAAVVGVLVASLAIFEYRAISDTLRSLAEHLEDAQKRRDFLKSDS